MSVVYTTCEKPSSSLISYDLPLMPGTLFSLIMRGVCILLLAVVFFICYSGLRAGSLLTKLRFSLVGDLVGDELIRSI